MDAANRGRGNRLGAGRMGRDDDPYSSLAGYSHPQSIGERESSEVTLLNKKICLLGDAAVGKTSLVRRFVYNLFDDKYLSTIGVKVSRKTVAVPGLTVLWN